MKIYLHGPRVGQTFKIKDIQFVEGVADVFELNEYYRRYYNVQDFPPEGLLVEEVKEKKEDSNLDEENQILLNVVTNLKEDSLKEVVNDKSELLQKLDSFRTFGQAKTFIKELTGKSPRNKEEAIELIMSHEG